MQMPPLRFSLQSLAARLSVSSDPADASVRVDGREIGNTPVTGDLAPGRHEVRVERKGFRPWVQQVEARAGETPSLEARLEAAAAPARGAIAKPTPTPKETPLLEGTLVQAGPDVTLPRKLKGEPAQYPDTARRLRLLGTVVVEMTVSEKGETTDQRVVESAGEILDQAVLAAVRTWHYEPGQKQGVKVKLRIRYKQTFQPAS
jgi:TonB family protein